MYKKICEYNREVNVGDRASQKKTQIDKKEKGKTKTNKKKKNTKINKLMKTHINYIYVMRVVCCACEGMRFGCLSIRLSVCSLCCAGSYGTRE